MEVTSFVYAVQPQISYLCLMTQVVIPSYPYVDILECVLTCFLSLTAHTGCFLRSLKFFLKITFIFR